MVSNFIIFFFLVSYPIFVALITKKTKNKIKSLFSFYFKDILSSLILLAAIYFLNPSIYGKLDFNAIGKGIIISDEWVSVILPVFFIPFFLSFAPWNNNKKNKDYELLGYPVYLLPNNKKEHLLFTVYITTGVVFEELVCRQFMFYSFHEVLNLRGDAILVISSFLFALGHFYQGWKGALITFVFSLIWGKIFQIKESIIYPIVLHLFLNLTVVVLAFKRLRTVKNNTYSST